MRHLKKHNYIIIGNFFSKTDKFSQKYRQKSFLRKIEREISRTFRFRCKTHSDIIAATWLATLTPVIIGNNIQKHWSAANVDSDFIHCFNDVMLDSHPTSVFYFSDILSSVVYHNKTLEPLRN